MTLALDILNRLPLPDLLEDELTGKGASNFRVDDADPLPRKIWERALIGPLSRFLQRPGKEFRARLVESGWRLGGCGRPMPQELPLVVEMLHAGSLIVDDIQDGSAYRRGGRALHCEVGVPVALNAGNWMYFWPEQILSRLGFSPSVELMLRREIARAMTRSHNGQALDLAVAIDGLEADEIQPVATTLTRLKSGSLFALALALGAIVSGASVERIEALRQFGEDFGAGLQMLDDLSGIEVEARTHKGHEDLIGGRVTWVWAFVAKHARDDLDRLMEQAAEVRSRDLHPEALAEALREVLGTEPRQEIEAHFDRALGRLEGAIGKHPEIALLRHEIEQLGRSYG